MANTKISALASGNPALSSDIIPIDRAGTNVSLTAGSIAALANPSIATAGQGYFIPGGFPLTTAPSAQAISTAQQVRCTQFELDSSWTITKATLTIVGISAASTVTLGIYSADGNTKLIDSGLFDGGTASVQTKTFGAATLPKGIYWFAQSASTPTTLTAQTITPNANMLALVNNQTLKHVGLATNVAVSGVLPPTLGSITGASINIVMAAFEP